MPPIADDEFAPLKLDDGLYYANIEVRCVAIIALPHDPRGSFWLTASSSRELTRAQSWVSTMETESVAAWNVVGLWTQNRFGFVPNVTCPDMY